MSHIAKAKASTHAALKGLFLDYYFVIVQKDLQSQTPSDWKAVVGLCSNVIPKQAGVRKLKSHVLSEMLSLSFLGN